MRLCQERRQDGIDGFGSCDSNSAAAMRQSNYRRSCCSESKEAKDAPRTHESSIFARLSHKRHRGHLGRSAGGDYLMLARLLSVRSWSLRPFPVSNSTGQKHHSTGDLLSSDVLNMAPISQSCGQQMPT